MIQRAEGSFPRSHNSTLAGLLPAWPPASSTVLSGVSGQEREFSTAGIFFFFLPRASKRGLIAKTIENVYNKMKTIHNCIVFSATPVPRSSFAQETSCKFEEEEAEISGTAHVPRETP